MSGNKFLLDTNVVIAHLAGNSDIEVILEGASLYISSITYFELLAGNLSKKEEEVLRHYMNQSSVIHTNELICEEAARLRKKYKLKLPDAVVASTGLFLDIPLFIFDHDFYKVEDLQIIKLAE